MNKYAHYNRICDWTPYYYMIRIERRSLSRLHRAHVNLLAWHCTRHALWFVTYNRCISSIYTFHSIFYLFLSVCLSVVCLSIWLPPSIFSFFFFFISFIYKAISVLSYSREKTILCLFRFLSPLLMKTMKRYHKNIFKISNLKE